MAIDKLFKSKELSQKEIIQNELNKLDEVLPRCVEDLMVSMGVDETKLPQIMQDRLNKKEN